MIKFGAQMQALAVNCGFATQAKIDADKRQIRDSFLARKGVDGNAYDEVLDAAEKATKAKWDGATAAERE